MLPIIFEPWISMTDNETMHATRSTSNHENNVLMLLHRESKKTCHQTFVYIFTKYQPILKILSLSYSVVNLQ